MDRNSLYIGLMVFVTMMFLILLLEHRPAVPDGVPEISAVVVDDVSGYLIYRERFANK